jgi:hypothetical protein
LRLVRLFVCLDRLFMCLRHPHRLFVWP